MQKFRLLIIILPLFIFTSCVTAKKEKVGKQDVKVEKEEKESKSLYEYYSTADEIIEKEQRNRFQEARENIIYIIANIDPDKVLFKSTDAYQLLALLNIKEKRYKEAIETYEMALQKDPALTEAINGIGFSYMALGKYEDAVKYFDKILIHDPNNFAAHMNFGIVSYRKKEYEKAIEYFKKAATSKAYDHRPYYNIAEAYFALGNLTEAEKFYKKAIEADRHALRAKKNLSYILLKNKKFKEALEVFESETEVPSHEADFYINLAVAQRTAGKLEQAEKNYRKVLDINPQSTAALKNLGILYDIYFGKKELALVYYKKYVELDGEDKKNVQKWIKIIKGSGAKRGQ